jgi:hypothetical protein
MIAKDSIEIFDLYDLMPGYGESSVELLYSNRQLTLIIGYDFEDQGTKITKIHFEDCVGFEFVSFPGVTMYNNQRDKDLNLGSLIEFRQSDYADLWDSHFKYKMKRIRHFGIIFLSENNQLNVFAEKVVIT